MRVWTDSSAAIGICNRQGLGKLRHLDTHTLWIQQAVRTSRIHLKKIDGDSNPADLFTKHSLTRERLMKLVRLFDCHFMSGRADSAPKLRRSQQSKCTLGDAGLDQGRETEEAYVIEPGQREANPCMPHTCLDRASLELQYPDMTAADEPYTEYSPMDHTDHIYQHGLKIAQDIHESMQQFGRTKYENQCRCHK